MSYNEDAKWAQEIQSRLALKEYKKVWPGAKIIELDKDRSNPLARIIDVGGADKTIRFPDGRIAFLGQRFRRWAYWCYNDFTLRFSRPGPYRGEFEKILAALSEGGFIASFYTYGLVNEDESDFFRFRILRFHPLCQKILEGELRYKVKANKDGSSTFLTLPFRWIPQELLLYERVSDPFPPTLF